jgi:hypothetical protein
MEDARSRHRKPCLVVGIALALGVLLPEWASAQQAAPPTNPTQIELAKSVHNPFEDFVKIPIQATTGFNLGNHHEAGEAVNIEPLIPVRLTAQWDLLVRPSLTVGYLPTPSSQFGLTDAQTSLYLTPASASEWIWGAGPILQAPTASSTDLGSGKWAAGPTAGFAYNHGPWFNGILAYQLMSFAGAQHRGSINQTYMEPQLSYNLDSGWYGQIDPPITYNWTAQKQDAWTLPIGADVGNVVQLGGQHLGLQIGSYDFVKHPQGGPGWMIRVQVTLLFPTSRSR